MNDIPEPTKINRPRDEGVLVPRIEKEKKAREELDKNFLDRSQKILYATFVTYLKKLFDSFSSKGKLAGKVVDLSQPIEHLEAFKTHLQVLSKEDQSQNPKFAIQLSELWHKLTDDFDNMQVLERKNLSRLVRFRQFLDSIKRFPPQSDHTLGFYLIEHAGKDWLPFPYIEILSDLHKQFKADENHSMLKRWISDIDLIIGDFEELTKFEF